MEAWVEQVASYCSLKLCLSVISSESMSQCKTGGSMVPHHSAMQSFPRDEWVNSAVIICCPVGKQVRELDCETLERRKKE